MRKRIFYPKEFKKFALAEISDGKRLEDVISSSGYDISELIKKDKKYCAKLLYKWRKEFADKTKSINLPLNNVTKNMINFDIENMFYEDETDLIMYEMKDKIRFGVEKYKNLKERIINNYCVKKKIFKKF